MQNLQKKYEISELISLIQNLETLKRYPELNMVF